MKILVKLSILFLVAYFGTSGAISQNVGYVNSVVVINSIAETSAAKAKVKDFEKSVQLQFEASVTAFQTKLNEAQQKAKNGEYTPVQQKEIETTLANEQANIQKLENELIGKVKEKEKELYAPIYTRANEAISAIAKEAGFKMVLDSSAGIVLYAEENTDITKRVIDKLKN